LIPEIDRHRMHLNRDSPFAFQVHVVKHLGAEFARGNRPGLEEELVGQRALAVVDVGNDREIANVAGRRHVTREKTVYLSSAVYWFFQRLDRAGETPCPANRRRDKWPRKSSPPSAT